MTTDKIINLAKQAGFTANDEQGVFLRVHCEEIERFASLIRNEVLEEAAGVCIETGSTKGSCDAAFDIADACAAAIRAMKEQT